MKKRFWLIGIFTALVLVAEAEEQPRKNLALSCAVFCNDGENPEYAVDGIRGGKFYGGRCSPKNYLEVDLGKISAVDGVRAFFWYGDSRFYQYYIAGSLDGKIWCELMDRRNNTKVSSAEGDGQDFPCRQMRFVRIHTLYNSMNAATHIREIEIYGK